MHEVLARQVVGLGSIQGISVLRETGDLFGQAIGCPIRCGSMQFGRCAGVDEFLENTVNRGNIRCVSNCFEELGREPALTVDGHPRALEQIVQLVGASLSAQHHADLAEACAAEALAGREELLGVAKVRGNFADCCLVLGVTLEIDAVARCCALVGQLVDLIDMDEAGQASRDEAGFQTLGRK